MALEAYTHKTQSWRKKERKRGSGKWHIRPHAVCVACSVVYNGMSMMLSSSSSGRLPEVEKEQTYLKPVTHVVTVSVYYRLLAAGCHVSNSSLSLLCGTRVSQCAAKISTNEGIRHVV